MSTFDPRDRDTLERIAQEYEQMAATAEEQDGGAAGPQNW
jgi:hypothetical protein